MVSASAMSTIRWPHQHPCSDDQATEYTRLITNRTTRDRWAWGGGGVHPPPLQATKHRHKAHHSSIAGSVV